MEGMALVGMGLLAAVVVVDRERMRRALKAQAAAVPTMDKIRAEVRRIVVEYDARGNC